MGALLAGAAGGRSVQQLTPELAEELAHQQAVLFIDAWRAPGGAAPQLVEVEALRFAFPLVMEGTIAAGAELRIEIEPAECHCAVCAAPFPAPQGCCDCPRCGTISLRLLRGRDLRLLSLEVE